MKKFFILFLFYIFTFVGVVRADTETINWYVDGNIYTTTTCESGGDIILPNAPTKYGYTFQGWRQYTPVEYLQSSGTQYIDTGYYPNQDTSIELVFRYESGVSGFCISGEINGTSGGPYAYYVSTKQWGYDSYYTYSYTLTNGTYKVEIAKEGNNVNFKINDEVIDVKSASANPWVSPRTFYLFGMNRGSAGSGSLPRTRIESFKVKEHGVLIRDFIPVLDLNNIPCMYDTIEGNFYYNAGTGDFIAGPVITE